MQRLFFWMLLLALFGHPTGQSAAQTTAPSIAERADDFRRDPTNYIKCVQLKFEHAAHGDGRPFEQAFPDLDATCRAAEAASAAAHAQRTANWQPDWTGWIGGLMRGYLIGIPIGLVLAALSRSTSVGNLAWASNAAGTGAAASFGLLSASMVSEDRVLADFSVWYLLLMIDWRFSEFYISIPVLGQVGAAEISEAGIGALAGLLLLTGLRFADPWSLKAAKSELRSAQENVTRRASPVALVAGLALIVSGFAFVPRTYSGLSTEGWLTIGLGIVSMAIVPVLCAWRTASGSTLLAAAALLLGAAIATAQYASAGPTLDTIVILTGLAAIAALLEGWRKIRVGARGLLRATRFAFTWPMTSESGVNAAAKRLSVEELVAAYHLPEHTALAREAINHELVARGERPQARNEDWLPEPRRATLGPPFTRAIPAERYVRYIRNRLHLVRVIRVLGVAGAVTVVGLLLIAPMLSLIVIIGGWLGRKRAGRVLLLRPFNQPRMTTALKTVVRSHLGPLGHTVTLSDRGYRPNFVLAILTRLFDWATLIAGPLLRPSFRIASVKDERTFFKLAGFLTEKWRPSTFGLLCSDQAFNVRTTDQWWKRCIDLLLRSSDLIVMDISRISNGSAWEISQLSHRGLLEPCVFICQEDHLDEARTTLRSLLPDGIHPSIHVFTDNGVFTENSAELKSQLVARMAAAASTWGSPRAS